MSSPDGYDFRACSQTGSSHLVLIEEASTSNGERKPGGRSGLAGQIFQVVSYLALCLWLIWIANTERSESKLAERLGQIIFVDFFGYFLVSILFAGFDKSMRWRWPLRPEEGGRLGGYLFLVLAAGWFMEGLAGWAFTVLWMFGILASLSDIPSLRSGALVRVIWGVVSAFLVAIVASIGGVAQDDLLQEHLPTLLAWGLLYFGGVFVFRVIRLWKLRSGG